MCEKGERTSENSRVGRRVHESRGSSQKDCLEDGCGMAEAAEAAGW